MTLDEAIKHAQEAKANDICSTSWRALAVLGDALKVRNSVIDEVHSWAVCAAIATTDDLMQNIGRIVDISAPDYAAAPQEQAPADKDAKLIGDIGIAAIGMDFATSYNTNHPGEWHFTNSGLKSVSNSLIDAVSAVALEALETSEPMIKTLESLQRHADAIRALKAEVSNG